jgi:D-erythrulose 1-phosphate 3-epimerase
MTPKVTLGINTCFAVKRWPEADQWARIIRERLGLDRVQFSFDLADPLAAQETGFNAVERIRSAADRYELRVESCFTGLAAYSMNLLLDPDEDMRRWAEKWYAAAIRFAGALGCDSVGGHLGAMSMYDYHDARRHALLEEQLVGEVHRLASIAREAGLKCLLWEPMPVERELLTTIQGATRMLDFVNEDSPLPVRLCLDLGHMCCCTSHRQDADALAWIRALGNRSPVIHLQQNDGKSDSHLPFTDECNRSGIVRPSAVLTALDESGATETSLVLEVIHSFECPEEQVVNDLEQSVRYWRNSLV